MLMRRARAYDSNCSQVFLVYLHPFRRTSRLCSQKLPKKSQKTNIFKMHGRSKSSMLTLLRSSSPVLVMISSMSVPICSHFHARQANTGIIIFVEGAPLSPPRSCGPTWLSSINFCAEILESRLSYGENQNSLSHLGLNRYRLMTYGQTNRQTNRITIANTVYAL